MNINELFEKIQDKFSFDELNGEIVLLGNCIIWEYNLDDDCENIEISKDNDDDEIIFDFESSSSEELLNEAYNEDIVAIEQLFDELDETDNWSFSEPEICENVISFKIF